jgi:hypothetical protein
LSPPSTSDRQPTRRERLVFAGLLPAFGALLAVLAWSRPQALLGAAVFLAGAWVFSLIFGGPGRRRRLGTAGLVLLVGIPAWLLREGLPAAPVAAGLVALLVAAAAVVAARPEPGAALWRAWLEAAEPVGWSVSVVVLAAVWWLVVTPVGIVLRLTGHDPLEGRFDRKAESHWVDLDEVTDTERYFRQF